MTDQTDAYLEHFDHWLTEKLGGRPPCPLCHNADVELVFRPGLPIWAAVRCRNCAHLLLFDSEAIGVVPASED